MGTTSNIYSNAISYNCAKFGAFVNSVTILMLRDLTIRTWVKVFADMGAQNSAQLTKSVTSKCTVLDATITGSEKASAPNQTMAIAKRTTFLVITFFIGNRIAKLRSREIATKLKIEAI